jgi:hypothetical protein
MSKLNIHIPSGDHTRTLLCGLAVVALAAAFIPSPQASASGGGYGWPMKPFDRPHPVRGGFGDPRTVFRVEPSTSGVLTGGGKFAFHFGVDIAAPNGTPVYPVVNGTVSLVSHEKPRERVEVLGKDGRSYHYWHIRPTVRPGQRVEAQQTVLGTILAPYKHVHFGVFRGGRPVNPVSPGQLTPYADTTTPEVVGISVRADDTGPSLMPSLVRGRVVLIAEAYDRRDLRIPGVWNDMPVTPALVSWQLRGLTTKRVVGGIAADFRVTTPEDERFWSYYARGTYQNMSVFGSHYSWAQPGSFLFKLTRSSFDTRSVPDGVYDLVVTVSDIAGHTSSRSLRLTISNS